MVQKERNFYKYKEKVNLNSSEELNKLDSYIRSINRNKFKNIYFYKYKS